MLTRRVSADDDHYRALDVAHDAGTEEIRAAWRLLLVAYHPDRFRDPEQRRRAEEITERANAAWQTLGDPERRRRVDRIHDHAPVPSAPAPRDRELPCPSCATRCRTPDAGGRTVHLVCPACGESFPAMIGARFLGRPRLQSAGWGCATRGCSGTRTGTSAR